VYSFPMHMHTYYEMTLYRPFRGGVLINGERREIDTVSAVLICPSDFHEILVEEPTDSTYIKISFNGDVFRGNAPDASAVLTDLDPNGFLAHLFEELLAQGEDRRYAEHLISAAAHRVVKEGSDVRPASVSRGYRIVIECANYLHEHFRETIDLKSVAERLSVSPQYLSTIFKRNMGVNFATYLIRLRLDYAAFMLRKEDVIVTEICFECGFSNMSHFTRSFHKAYGQSPTEYRKSFFNSTLKMK